ncbi:MAG: gliding motility-associated C-terminal domain-containing protein [Chitinophagales bacterium]|jgi:gliding motility-associated-like protein|nr:gliding motility-associated C-terminal domain-containing protein [Sphingobacteriales bacterium]
MILTITRNSVCLPAKVSKYITFKPNTTVHFDTVTKCQGQTYTIGTRTYSSPGNYKDTILEHGCPKIVQTTLNFLTASKDTIKRNICNGDTIYIKGIAITQSGIFYDSLRNRFGCDSILIYDVKVLSLTPSATSLYDTICLGESRIFNNQILTTSGIYKAKYTNVLGCDSTVTLFLNVITPLKVFKNASICIGDTFKLDTFTFTKTGIYNISFKSGKNCDSTIELNLKVNPSYFFSTKSSVCLGKSVAFYGQNYSRTGLYYKKFQTINGCDSIYELDLRIFRIVGIENYEFCKGDSLKILNRYVKTSGDYYDTFKLPSGCDSFHLTKVNVRTWPVQQIDTVLCADDSFIYKNMVYKQAAIISDTIFSNYKTSCHKLKFIYLDFKNCDTLNECSRILIPTGFTPNNDGINDKLSLIVKSEKINIVDFVLYNRWGHLVYNYFDYKEGWNGLYKGDDAPVGVYNYSLKYKCKGQNYNKSGNVTLLR